MIVDVHTHFLDFDTDIGPDLRADMRNCGIEPTSWKFTQEEYLEATKEADRVILFGLRAAKTGWNAPNQPVAEFAARHPHKYIYFVSIDPNEPDFMEQMEHAVKYQNAKGVKVGPVYQGLHPLDEKYDPIYAYCERHELPLMTHMATTFTSRVPLEYARPIHMDAVACRYPGLRIILAHMGHPWMAETLAVVRRQANVFADVSALYYRPWQFYQGLQLAVEYGCTRKLLMGSDYPATTTGGTIKAIRAVNEQLEGTGMPRIPTEVLESIIHADALKMLGIRDSAPARALAQPVREGERA